MKILNIIFLPIRFLLSHELLNKLGLRSLKDDRINMAMKHCKGRVLDIGCGDNQLIKKYNQEYNNDSVGVDLLDLDNEVLVVKDTSKLPLSDKSFQTVTFLSSFQYILNHRKTVKEAYRILNDDGIILITVLSPLIGWIRYKLAWWDEDQNKIGLEESKRFGLSYKEICSLMEEYFDFTKQKRFTLGLNNLYIFKKKMYIK